MRDQLHKLLSSHTFKSRKPSPHIENYSKYGAIVDATDFKRTLSKNDARLKYGQYAKEESTIHHGQRKLLMSEIEFLVDNYDKYKNRDVTLLYVGAAPGTHIIALAKLFPFLKYHLYDKTSFDVKLQGPNIKIFREYFTDEHAEQYAQTPVIFVSDIRSTEILGYNNKNTDHDDQVVQKDMLLQESWYNIINPLCALLKFRLPWNDKRTTYLDGKIYFQVWQGKHSSETRLSPFGKNMTREYDNIEYDEQLHHFNRIERRKRYKTHIECYGNCYDCFSEAYILSKYLQLMLNNDNVSENVCKLRGMIDQILKPLF